MQQSDIDLVNQPIPNMPLLDRVIDRIENNLDSWNQNSWGDLVGDYYAETEPCGTTNCFAGHAVIEAGVLNMDYVRVEGEGFAVWDVRWTKGDKVVDTYQVPVEARIALGITEREAHEIFYHFHGMDEEGYDDETYDAYLALPMHERKQHDLMWFKTKVEEIRGRSRQQEAAFNRIAEELIAQVPQLEEVLAPGYQCPESRQALLQVLDTFKGDA